ncbi:MAG: cytochrome c3 family protein [Kofleriaceae bacterium]
MLVLCAIAAVIGGAVMLADARHGEPDRGEAWSPIVYPEQRLPLIFSHARHLQRGATCAMCHPAVASSRSAVDNLLPTEAQCRACHPIDRGEPERVVAGAPPARCAACHAGYVAGGQVERVYLTPPPLKFAHAAHAATPCATCHGDLSRVDLATTRQLPTMAACLSCHKSGASERGCADCHLTRRGGLLQTELPHGALVPRNSGLGDAHGPGFAKDHRQEAMQVDASCTACHDRSECLACHQGVTKPLDFHAGNYLLTHGVEARRGTPDCSACHRAQSFCVGCHERSGVGMRVDSGFDGSEPARSFHPAGWAAGLGAQNLHAREARRNLTSCASCHREEDCLACHSAETTSLGVSPHGKGWRGSARCRSLDRSNRRMCLRCHITQDELGCDWGR